MWHSHGVCLGWDREGKSRKRHARSIRWANAGYAEGQIEDKGREKGYEAKLRKGRGREN